MIIRASNEGSRIFHNAKAGARLPGSHEVCGGVRGEAAVQRIPVVVGVVSGAGGGGGVAGLGAGVERGRGRALHHHRVRPRGVYQVGAGARHGHVGLQ